MTLKRSAGFASLPVPFSPQVAADTMLQEFIVVVALRYKVATDVYCCCFLLLLCTNLVLTEPSSSVSSSPRVTNKVASVSSVPWGRLRRGATLSPTFLQHRSFCVFAIMKTQPSRHERLSWQGLEPGACAGCVSLFPAETREFGEQPGEFPFNERL